MDLWQLILTIITIVAVMAGILGACAYLIWVERKIAAYMQDRIGPNRVGWFGLGQPIADGLKFLFKEDVIPSHVDKPLYLLAPCIAVSTALLAFAVVPFGPTAPPPRPLAVNASPEEQQAHEQQEDASKGYQWVIAPRVDIGIVFIFAVTSLTVYAIILGGWSSNNKYSFMGAMRSSAQLVSYEIPMGMSVLGIFLITGSLNLERIIGQQIGGGWNIVYQPLGFLLFLTAAFAECNRLPFDLPEAEQELVGGYHTEYSALKFGLFFVGEYAHMITTSFLLSILFFGGWHFWWISTPTSPWWIKLIVLWLKVVCFILFYMLVRWTIPRFRFDQLMGLAWKVLIPLALFNLLAVMIVKQCILVYDLSPAWLWILLPVSLVLLVVAAVPAVLWRPPTDRRPMVTVSGPERTSTMVAR
jgi:NADH-quinone oxidoreductase subunit H